MHRFLTTTVKIVNCVYYLELAQMYQLDLVHLQTFFLANVEDILETGTIPSMPEKVLIKILKDTTVKVRLMNNNIVSIISSSFQSF